LIKFGTHLPIWNCWTNATQQAKSQLLISEHKMGLDAKKKSVMPDGKNWFDEKNGCLQT